MPNSFLGFTSPQKSNRNLISPTTDVYETTSPAAFAEITNASVSSLSFTGKGIATDGTYLYIINQTQISKTTLTGTVLNTSTTYTSLTSPTSYSIFVFGNFVYLFTGLASEGSAYTVYNKADLSTATTGNLSGSNSYTSCSGYNSSLPKIFYINNYVYIVSFGSNNAYVRRYYIGAGGGLVFDLLTTVSLGTYTSAAQIGCDYSKALNAICFFNAYTSYISNVNQVISLDLNTNATYTNTLSYSTYAASSPYLRFYCDSTGNFIILYVTSTSTYNVSLLYVSSSGSIIWSNPTLASGSTYALNFVHIIVTKYQWFLNLSTNAGSVPYNLYCFKNGSASPTNRYINMQLIAAVSGYETSYPYHYQTTGNGIFLNGNYSTYLVAVETITP